ncbi:retrotransposon protein, putative, ty1-copia subclass [Tanacetum coccineum]
MISFDSVPGTWRWDLGKKVKLRMRATFRITICCSVIVREEFRDGIGPFNDSGENPPPVTIHTWLERFNKQNPHSFDNAAAPKDAENRISHLEEILMFSRQVVETQESVVMGCGLPEIASSTARLATSSKMTRRTLRQVHLVTLTRKPDAFGRVFAITQNQTTDISSTITDASLILELQRTSRNIFYPRRRVRHLVASGAKPIAETPYRISPVKCDIYGVDKSSFHKFLDKFVIVLINDILISTKSNEEHEDQLCTVIQIFQQGKLYTKFSKCKFWLSKVVFLGHVVPTEGIAMGPRKFLTVAYLTKLTRKDEKLYGSKSERRSLKNDIPAEDRATTRYSVRDSTDMDHVLSFRFEFQYSSGSYSNKLSRPLSLQPNYLIFLKVSPTSGDRRFGITDKFCFIRPFEILDRVIHEDLSHLNEPEAILNCQDRVRIFRPFSKDILSFHDSSPELLCFPIFMSFAMILYMFDFKTYSIARAIYTHDHDLHDLPPSHGGHWKRNCPQYLAELLKKKKNAVSGAGGSGIFAIELNTFLNRSWIYDTGCGTHICNTTQGLRASRKLKSGALSLYVGNGQREAVEAIGNFDLSLPSGLVIVLNNCHYAPSITRGVISVSRLYEDGFINRFVNNTIQVSRNNMVYFSAIPRDGIFEIDLSNSYANESSIYTVSNKRAKLDLDSALLWHCRLGHISKKRIEKLQHDGLLNSTDLRAFEKCVPCMSGKMARKPYTHQVERAKDLLGLIHTDVCGPFKITSRQGASYFVTFTDDFSRYGYVYLLKHKHEVFETFKVFQKEVENQLGKTIKSLHSDRGGEYISQEFLDHLKDHEIIAHRTPPYTPQHNGVSERRNRTLLDMVRSMMSQTTLPKSFWDYAF